MTLSISLFPPIAADAHSLRPVVERLAASGVATQIVPFPSGGGWPVPGRPSFADVADEFARRTSEPSTIVAVAAGAYVANELLLRHPELVGSAVYVGGGFAPTADPALRDADRARADAVRDGLGAVVEETIARWFSPEAIAADAVEVRGAREALGRMPPEDWRDLWHAIAERATVPDSVARTWRLPVTLVAPTEDATRSAALLEAMHRQLPRSRYLDVSGPHMLALERPGSVSEAVLDHLDWALRPDPALTAVRD